MAMAMSLATFYRASPWPWPRPWPRFTEARQSTTQFRTPNLVFKKLRQGGDGVDLNNY